MKIGYARVSTVGQDYQTQKEILENSGCEKIYKEKMTGTSTKQRTELRKLLDNVRAGDDVYITKIDRLARSITDLNKIVQELKQKGVSVHFISEGMSFKAEDKNNSLQTVIFNILGSFAQFERDMIVERTTDGRERAKKQGKHMGRPSQPKKNIQKALKLYDEREQNGMSVNEISKLTDVPYSTIYNELKKRPDQPADA